MSNDRLHAAEATAIGTGMIGGASAANYGLDRMLERKKVKTPPRAILHEAKRLVRGGGKTAAHPLHAPYVAGKVATTSVRAVGLPLAAYGAFNLVSPGDKVARVRFKDDVVKPTVRTATGFEQANRAKNRIKVNREARKRTQMVKSALTDKEYNQLQRRKTVGRHISLAAGTMGLTALGLRAPELARATSKVPRVGKLKALQNLARREKGATQASNALGIAAIGTGSVGSFNYAAQQKLEQKKFAKGLPRVLKVPNTKNLDRQLQHYAQVPANDYALRRIESVRNGRSIARNMSRKGTPNIESLEPFDRRMLTTARRFRTQSRKALAGKPYSGPESGQYKRWNPVAKAQLPLPGMPDKPLRALRTGKRVWVSPVGRKEVVTDHGPTVNGLHKITRLHPKTGAETAYVTDPKKLGAWVKFGKSAAWERAAGKNPKGGLNEKGRESYHAQTGGTLKAPVKSGDNPRRASFLARMGNMRGPEFKPNGEPTRLLLSLRAWGASSKDDARSKAKAISGRDGVGKALTSEQKARAKARARAAGRPYPNAFDNMVAGGAPWRVKKGLPSALKRGRIATSAYGVRRQEARRAGQDAAKLVSQQRAMNENLKEDVAHYKSKGERYRYLADSSHVRRVAQNLVYRPTIQRTVDNGKRLKADANKYVVKADDRFLRKYRERISPEAEAGYKYLKRGRNRATGNAALNAALTPINAHAAVNGFRHGGKAGVAWGATGAGLTALTGMGAVTQGRKAVRWDKRMAGIESKAKERTAAGVYGRGRVVEKGLIPVIKPRIPLAARKPAIRSGHVATSVLGRKYTVRGSVR
jgi:hypothetical protein